MSPARELPTISNSGPADFGSAWLPGAGAARLAGLDALEWAFRLLVSGPSPLAVDGAEIGYGLPQRLINLDELAALLLHPSAGHATRDAAWRELIERARHEPEWMLGAGGVAMPMLRRIAGELARGCPGPTEDIDATVLEAFVTAIRSIQLTNGRIALTLRRAIKARAVRALHQEAGPAPAETEVVETAAPHTPQGHPDLVLAEAVRQNVITRFSAQVIGSTRLENIPIGDLAEALGMSYWALAKHRRRAELALAEAIRDGRVGSSPMS